MLFSTLQQHVQSTTRRLPWNAVWREVQRSILLFLGIFVGALGYVIFQIPHNIAAGGIGGLALIASQLTGYPNIGVIFWILNIPMIILGFFFLGKWSFVWRTLLAGTLFSIMTDLLLFTLPTLISEWPVTDNMVLNTIYGGIVGGIGGGLIYRSGATLGGTAVLARIVQRKTGWPLSQIYIYDDGLIILAMGLAFGWENALYGFMMLFLNGMASDYVLEGVSNTRTVTIVTDHPQAVIDALRGSLNRGSSYWEITGGYSGAKRYMVMSTISRAQYHQVRSTVAAADENAFVTIGISHQALGTGFARLGERRKV